MARGGLHIRIKAGRQLTAIKNQWFAGTVGKGLDRADDNDVVTTVELLMITTFERRQATGQFRAAAQPVDAGNAIELICLGGRKTPDPLLIF